ncbi:hypothetical protein LAZ40_01445 [Cereibacter sphaeroides]|uniref:hypothetical protein n=1 Tax=Cereibacter sphaeroides TaxID=1063 RepID=UPI001F23E842|nr:hypothetical protein [Cereibacter sphaeroides]MCE6957724.1 hypothetical protein [Cereibacter sphaeroides]MCE6971510.1 hypothetical protein [Cereibacter sphaeroides]
MGRASPLPYIFDLLWDIKTREKLVEALKHEGIETVVEMREAMLAHGVKLTDEERLEIEEWHAYLAASREFGM